VSGPTALAPPPGLAEFVAVETAHEMRAAVLERIDDCALFVAAAAVADYRPATVAPAKLKKTAATLELRLVRNPDILAEVAARARVPFLVGFAAETEDLAAHARAKLGAKRLDLIVANRVAGATGGFERDENEALVLWRGGEEYLPLQPKTVLAQRLAVLIAHRYAARTTQNS